MWFSSWKIVCGAPGTRAPATRQSIPSSAADTSTCAPSPRSACPSARAATAVMRRVLPREVSLPGRRRRVHPPREVVDESRRHVAGTPEVLRRRRLPLPGDEEVVERRVLAHGDAGVAGEGGPPEGQVGAGHLVVAAALRHE